MKTASENTEAYWREKYAKHPWLQAWYDDDGLDQVQHGGEMKVKKTGERKFLALCVDADALVSLLLKHMDVGDWCKLTDQPLPDDLRVISVGVTPYYPNRVDIVLESDNLPNGCQWDGCHTIRQLYPKHICPQCNREIGHLPAECCNAFAPAEKEQK